MANELQKSLGNDLQKSDDTRSQLGNFDGDITILEAVSDRLNIGNYRIKEKTQVISSDKLLWGNAAFGIWGSYYWGNIASAGFILGHTLAGIIGGVNKLGSQASQFEISAVYNDNNHFPEGFWNDRFIDTVNSTGSYYEEDEVYEIYSAVGSDPEFDSGSYLQTEYIAKENKIYKSVTIDINTEDGIGSDVYYLRIFASNDGGTVWQEIYNNTTAVLSGGTVSGLKIRIRNDWAGAGLEIPAEIPITFYDTKTIRITDFTVDYE